MSFRHLSNTRNEDVSNALPPTEETNIVDIQISTDDCSGIFKNESVPLNELLVKVCSFQIIIVFISIMDKIKSYEYSEQWSE